MTSDQRVTAAFIIIGNEILSGRTQDANLSFLAGRLGEIGIQVVEARVIPDVEQTIIDTVQTLSAQVDYVFTSGGIGPTHDDLTIEGIAAGFGVPVEHSDSIEERIRRAIECERRIQMIEVRGHAVEAAKMRFRIMQLTGLDDVEATLDRLLQGE